MLKSIFGNREEKLIRQMGTAIFWKDDKKVASLLRKGVKPSGWFGDQTFLAHAVFRNAKDIAKMLIEAGADPLEPYFLAGVEYRLSDTARMFNLSADFIQMLEEAEANAERKSGPRQLKNFNSCPIRPHP